MSVSVGYLAMSNRYYFSPPPPSSDAVSHALQALKHAVSTRHEAIQCNNYSAEQAADHSIARHFHTLSRDTIYPPSFPAADRQRTARFFKKLASKYPRSSRKDKDAIIRSLDERAALNGGIEAALTGLAALAVTGLVVGGVVFVATSADERSYGNVDLQTGSAGYQGNATALLRGDDENGADSDDCGLDPSGGMNANMDADPEGGGCLECCLQCLGGLCGF